MLVSEHGLARRQSKRAMKHMRDVIKENRTHDEVLMSLGMADGTG